MYSIHLLIHSKIFPIGTFKIRISVRQMTKISLYMHFNKMQFNDAFRCTYPVKNSYRYLFKMKICFLTIFDKKYIFVKYFQLESFKYCV